MRSCHLHERCILRKTILGCCYMNDLLLVHSCFAHIQKAEKKLPLPRQVSKTNQILIYKPVRRTSELSCLILLSSLRPLPQDLNPLFDIPRLEEVVEELLTIKSFAHHSKMKLQRWHATTEVTPASPAAPRPSEHLAWNPASDFKKY